MTWFDLHLIEGVARPLAVEAPENDLTAASAEFAAAWGAVQDVFPTATLQLLFGGEDGLSRDVIADLADAARMSGVEPPDLLRWFELECPDELTETLLPLLEALPLFDWVGERPEPVPAMARDGVVSWGTNPKAEQNPVLRGGPKGVGAIHGWRVDGGAGLEVKVADVERGWWLGHEDLMTARIVEHSVFGPPTGIPHGTLMAGLVVGADNGVGDIGIAPDAELLLVSAQRENGVVNPARAIEVAAKAVGPGGVLLLTLAWRYNSENDDDAGDLILETSPSVHAAIRCASIYGVTVVEAAGNGAIDFHAPPKPRNPKSVAELKLDLKLPMQSDSGAIVVGAGRPKATPGTWERWRFSNHGTRVDCFAQGTGVPGPKTTSPSDRDLFSGTSVASAIVAGLVANIQGMAVASGRPPLAPQDIRDLLRDPQLGTSSDETGIRSMPDLRKIAISQGWARVLPVAAVPVADDSMLLVYLDDDDHVVRRHFSFFTGWGRPLAVLDKGDLWPAQPVALTWAEPDRLVYQVLASGPKGVHRAWWDSKLGQEPFTPLATTSGNTIAHGSTMSAVRAGDDELVLVGIDGEGQLIALPTGMLFPGLGGPVPIGGAARFRTTTGPAAVSLAVGSVEVVAIADNGGLLWCHGDTPFEPDWQFPVVEPSFTPFIPGARLAALGLDDKVLVAALGDQGWLHAIEIDPSQGAVAAAFGAPVVIDTGITFAAQGPLALARLISPPFDMVLVFGVDSEGAVQVSSRPVAGGDWAPVLAIPSDVKMSSLGGVAAITLPDLGIMAFAVGIDGRIRVALARSLFNWSDFALLPEGVPMPPNPTPTPTPASLLISNAFRGDPVLEAVAADKDRISRTRNAVSPAVRKIQHALLLWDAVSLPAYGEDGSYGDETAHAVRNFKADALGVPPAQIVDDVGPATVLRLDKIQAESEGLLGTRTTFHFANEYGDPLPGLDFTVTTPALVDILTTDADGNAATYLAGPAQIALDPGSALCAVGDLLAREWPPAGGFADGLLLTPAAPTMATVQPGEAVDIVVASRINLTASLVAPIVGIVRVEGRGVALDIASDRVTLALQATGNQTATALVDPPAPFGALPELPPLVGWTPIGTYTVRPGDTAQSLAEAFVGDPDGYAALSDHPPVPGEQLTLPEIPGWLGMAIDPVTAPQPVEWFTVSADQIVAAMLAGGDTPPLEDLLAVLDRPPATGPDAVTALAARAEALVAILSGPPIGPGREVEESV